MYDETHPESPHGYAEPSPQIHEELAGGVAVDVRDDGHVALVHDQPAKGRRAAEPDAQHAQRQAQPPTPGRDAEAPVLHEAPAPGPLETRAPDPREPDADDEGRETAPRLHVHLRAEHLAAQKRVGHPLVMVHQDHRDRYASQKGGAQEGPASPVVQGVGEAEEGREQVDLQVRGEIPQVAHALAEVLVRILDDQQNRPPILFATVTASSPIAPGPARAIHLPEHTRPHARKHGGHEKGHEHRQRHQSQIPHHNEL
mmetsp:Transcript_114471/g.324844  ORF Transcript_114471/g.324844 Transcript_114471/m.324844 type:complete len:256 (-) Transcript_114471:1530-2297(-)